MEEPVVDYSMLEFLEAFNHAGTQTDDKETGREFMTRWFAMRYPDPDGRQRKFDILIALLEYLAEHRNEFDAAQLNVSGSGDSGDLAHGALVRLLLGHFRQTLVPPRPEQVIKRATEIIAKDRA